MSKRSRDLEKKKAKKRRFLKTQPGIFNTDDKTLYYAMKWDYEHNQLPKEKMIEYEELKKKYEKCKIV